MPFVYTVPAEQVKLQKTKMVVGAVTLWVAVPVATWLTVVCFRLKVNSITDEFVRPLVGLALITAVMLLSAVCPYSLRIELEDDTIRRIQSRPFGLAPLVISFSRGDIAHIRENQKYGIMVHGRGRKGRYLDLHIPRFINNYDELRGRLAAWQPIQNSWL